jgi:hypothetical protein
MLNQCVDVVSSRNHAPSGSLVLLSGVLATSKDLSQFIHSTTESFSLLAFSVIWNLRAVVDRIVVDLRFL